MNDTQKEKRFRAWSTLPEFKGFKDAGIMWFFAGERRQTFLQRLSDTLPQLNLIDRYLQGGKDELFTESEIRQFQQYMEQEGQTLNIEEVNISDPPCPYQALPYGGNLIGFVSLDNSFTAFPVGGYYDLRQCERAEGAPVSSREAAEEILGELGGGPAEKLAGIQQVLEDTGAIMFKRIDKDEIERFSLLQARKVILDGGEEVEYRVLEQVMNTAGDVIDEALGAVQTSANSLHEVISEKDDALWVTMQDKINKFSIEAEAYFYAVGWNRAMVAAGRLGDLVTPDGLKKSDWRTNAGVPKKEAERQCSRLRAELKELTKGDGQMISYEGNRLISTQDAAKALGMTEEEMLAEMKRAGVPAVSLPMVVFPCPQCGTTIERVMENPPPEIILTCSACKCEAAFSLIAGKQWGVRVLEKGVISPPSAHELAFEAEKKRARAEGGTVLEAMVEMHGSIEAVKQALIDQAQRDPAFKAKMIQRGKEDWAEELEERKIPSVLNPGEERRYSLVHIIEAYGVSLRLFLQHWGIQWKGLTAGEKPYLTIEEMWDRDIYEGYLRKIAKEGR